MKLKTNLAGKRFRISIPVLLSAPIVLVFMLHPLTSFGQDASGANTGTLNDIDTSLSKVLDTVSKAKDSAVASVSSSVSKLSGAIQTIGNADGHNKIAINIMWTLITGFLVMFMQAGLH